MFFLQEIIHKQYESIEDPRTSLLFAKRSLIISTIFIIASLVFINNGEMASSSILAVLQLLADIGGVLFGLWVIVVSAVLMRYQISMSRKPLFYIAIFYQLVAMALFFYMFIVRIYPRWFEGF